jgi:hypothetical protein
MAFWNGRIAGACYGVVTTPAISAIKSADSQAVGGRVGFQEVTAMTVFSGFRLALCVFAVGFAGSAAAQENLDHGKSAAQLYASDCAICHKSPAALSKAGGVFGMESFLRQHYTASRESAAAISTYLKGFGDVPAGPVKKASTKKSSKGDDKKGEKKPDGAITLPGDNKPVEAKPAETKPSEAKAPETKPAEPKAEPAPAPKAD